MSGRDAESTPVERSPAVPAETATQLLHRRHVVLPPELEPLLRFHAELCRALGSEHRLGILCALREREICVSELASCLRIPVHSVSQHLRVLKEHKIVCSRKVGQTVFYTITNKKFTEACTLIREAIIEQHQAEGRFLLAAGLLDGAERSHAGSGEGTTPDLTDDYS